MARHAYSNQKKLMRYERGDKWWFDTEILPVSMAEFATIVTYGLKDPQGELVIIQPAIYIYRGPSYSEAERVMLAKIQNRIKVGYVKVEPKSDE